MHLLVDFLIISSLVLIVAASSCSKDDDVNEEPVYHQSYVQGKINGVAISMDDKNAYISSEKSLYTFVRRDNDKRTLFFAKIANIQEV